MRRERRQKAHWWLVLLLAILAFLNGFEALEIQRQSEAGVASLLPFSPGTRIALSAGWAALLALLAVGLVARRRWVLALAAPVLTLYSIFGLAWAVLFVQADYGRGRLAFQAVLAVLTLLPIWWFAIRRGWLRPRA